MITLTQYVGLHACSPDWNERRQEAATIFLKRCAAMEAEMRADGVKFPDNPRTGNGISGERYGGFRPQDCPIGASTSSHKEGRGLDRYDPANEIDAWCLAHQDRLEAYGIYIEHPRYTLTWSHWTDRAPRSKRTVFLP